MKNLLKLPVLLLAVMLFASCGDSKKEEEKKLNPVEKDAKRTAEMACDYFEAMDAEDKEKMIELEKEGQEIGEEMEEKYGEVPDDDRGSASKEDNKAYWETFEAEMEKCEAESWKQMKKAMGMLGGDM